jgi:hypothetical protein
MGGEGGLEEGVLKDLIRCLRRTKMHMHESKGQEKDRGGTREKGGRAARQVFMIQAVFMSTRGREGAFSSNRRRVVFPRSAVTFETIPLL